MLYAHFARSCLQHTKVKVAAGEAGNAASSIYV